MKRKKLLCMLLAAAMMLPFAGCKKDTKVADGDVPTLIYVVPGDPQSDEAIVEDALNEILVEKIGAKVDLQFIDWNAWAEKTNLMMATQEYFDIASGYQKNIPELVDNGSIYDMTDLLKKTPKLKEELPSYFWDVASVDGRVYCVPNQQIEASNTGIAVRKDLAEKYNFDVSKVETIMDLEPFWQAVRDNEKGIYPFKMSSSSYFVKDALGDKYEEQAPSSVYGATLIRIDYDTLKVSATPDFYGLKEGAKLAVECGNKGYFRADRATASDDSADMAAGKYASFTTWYKPGEEAELKNKTGYDYITKRITESVITEGSPLSTKTIMSAYTNYPEQSMKFIELLNTDKEVFNLISFGVEGKHYTWADDEHIQTNPDSGYCPNSSWVFGNVFNAYPQVGQEATVWEDTKALNDSASISPLMGIAFDTTDIQVELAQCQKIQQLYLIAMIDRAIGNPDEYWEEYRSKLQKAGVDKVIECYQKQVDEFMASKKD